MGAMDYPRCVAYRNSCGQDVLLTGVPDDFSISVDDPLNPLGPNPITFHRSNYDSNTGGTDLLSTPTGVRPDWRQQINAVTSFIDASNLYGSDAGRAAVLRTGVDGQLVTSAGGLLLGLKTANWENDDP